MSRNYLLLFYLLCLSQQLILSYPHSNDELVVVEEVLRAPLDNTNTMQLAKQQQDAVANESAIDKTDDLIVLAAKSHKQQQHEHNHEQHSHTDSEEPSEQIDFQMSLSSAEEITETAPDMEAQHYDAITPKVQPIDMSDFLALIPADEVKTIVANYYRNDADVQRAYAYLNSPEFQLLKGQILALPEVRAFLGYLNNSGLDVVGFLYAVTNVTSTPLVEPVNVFNETQANVERVRKMDHYDDATGNEIVRLAATTTQQPQAATTEHVSGLHGLVDSVLDALPQDEILSTFFDKLQTDEQFNRLLKSISTPEFAKLISNLQNSMALRNLIFTLHNNGIYITRIVDSLKAYFFLGTF